MDEAEYCDQLSIMQAGRLAATGTPAELRAEYGGGGGLDAVFQRLATVPGADNPT